MPKNLPDHRIVALEDARLTNKDIYLLSYIDSRIAFGIIDHARLLALVEDLGYPRDVVELIGNIYTKSTTSFQGNHFITTPLVQVMASSHYAQVERRSVTFQDQTMSRAEAFRLRNYIKIIGL